jgi:hypothetical protein
MNQARSPRRGNLIQLVLGTAVLALLAYYFWPRSEEAAPPAPAAPVVVAKPAPAQGTGTLGPGVRNVGGILLDADGNRILNSAGLPGMEPLPPAKPIPIRAAPNDIVGYSTDANGVSRPLRAKDIRGAANAPGTYVAVDMWAEGGPAVVTPTRPGRLLTEAEVEKSRAEERAREERARLQQQN